MPIAPPAPSRTTASDATVSPGRKFEVDVIGGPAPPAGYTVAKPP
jgi:hypothetical protein